MEDWLSCKGPARTLQKPRDIAAPGGRLSSGRVLGRETHERAHPKTGNRGQN